MVSLVCGSNRFRFSFEHWFEFLVWLFKAPPTCVVVLGYLPLVCRFSASASALKFLGKVKVKVGIGYWLLVLVRAHLQSQQRKSQLLSVICYLYVRTFHRISEIHTRSELVLIICVIEIWCYGSFAATRFPELVFRSSRSTDERKKKGKPLPEPQPTLCTDAWTLRVTPQLAYTHTAPARPQPSP